MVFFQRYQSFGIPHMDEIGMSKSGTANGFYFAWTFFTRDCIGFIVDFFHLLRAISVVMGVGGLLPDAVVHRGRISPSRASSTRATTPIFGRVSRPVTPMIESEPPLIDLSGGNAYVHSVLLAQRGVTSPKPGGDFFPPPSPSRTTRAKSPTSRPSTRKSGRSSSSPRKETSAEKTHDLSEEESFELPEVRPRSEKSRRESINEHNKDLRVKIARGRHESGSRAQTPSKIVEFAEDIAPASSTDAGSDTPTSKGDHRKKFMESLDTGLRNVDSAPVKRGDSPINQVTSPSPSPSPGRPSDPQNHDFDDELIGNPDVGPKKSFLQYILYHERPKYNIAMMAANRRFDKVISAIREYPPCVTDCEEDGSTALHHASIFNHELTVYVLLSNQADPNALESMGRTPLHWAANFGYCNIVQMLLRAGSRPNTADHHGHTAIELADKRKTWIYLNAWKKFKSAHSVEALCGLLSSEDKELTHLIIRELDERSEKGENCRKILEPHLFLRILELSRHNHTDYVCTKEIPNRIYVGRILSRMCEEAKSRASIIDLGGLGLIIALARAKEVENQYLAAHALRLVTDTDDNLEVFLREGGLIAMISLADTQIEKVLSEAYQPIMKLALNSENHELLIRKGGLRSIVSMASSVNIELRRTSAHILERMSQNMQNHAKITSEGALEKLAPLLSEVSDIRENAHSILEHLSMSESTRRAIYECIGVSLIVNSAKIGSQKCKSASVKTLQNLSFDEHLHDGMMEGANLDYIIGLYDALDEDEQESVDRLLVNLSMKESNRLAISSRGIVPLVAVLRTSNYAVTPKLATWSIMCLIEIAAKGDRLAIMKAGGLPPLLHILSDAESTSGSLVIATCKCISSLTASEEITKYLEKMQVLKSMLDALKNIRESRVLLALLNTSENLARASVTITQDFVGMGGLSTVIAVDSVCKSEEKIQTAIDSLLDTLSRNERNRPAIRESKSYRPYFAVLKVFEAFPVVNWSLEELSRLADVGERRVEIIHNGGLDLIIHSLISSKLSTEGKIAAIRCLGTLGEDALHVQGWIISKAEWTPFLETLPSRNTRFEEECARTIRVLLENEENQIKFIEAGGFRRLMSIPLYGQTAKHLAMCLSVLSENDKLKATLIHGGGLKLMVQISNTREQDVEQHLDHAITNLATKIENREMILSAIRANSRSKFGWMRLLTSIASSSIRSEDMYHWVASSLVSLADDSSFHQLFYDEEGISALELLSTCRYTSVQVLGTRGLRILAGARGAHRMAVVIVKKPQKEIIQESENTSFSAKKNRNSTHE